MVSSSRWRRLGREAASDSASAVAACCSAARRARRAFCREGFLVRGSTGVGCAGGACCEGADSGSGEGDGGGM